MDTVPSRIARARREAGLTQRDLANRIGTTVWAIDELERGRFDHKRLVPRIESATSKPSGWVLNGAQTMLQRSRAEEHAVSASLTTTQRFDRNLVLAVLAIIITVRFFTESVGALPSAGNFIDVLLLPRSSRRLWSVRQRCSSGATVRSAGDRDPRYLRRFNRDQHISCRARSRFALPLRISRPYRLLLRRLSALATRTSPCRVANDRRARSTPIRRHRSVRHSEVHRKPESG